MDRVQLFYDVVRAYIVVLVFTLTLLVVGLVFQGTVEFRGLTLIWYQLTGVGVLLAITYRIFKAGDVGLAGVGGLFLAWTIFLESVFLVYSRPGPLSVTPTDPATGYALKFFYSLRLFVLLFVVTLVSGVLFVLAVYFIRLVYTHVEAPATKALLYPLIFGIVIADGIGIALLVPSLPNSIPALSTAVVIWLESTILSVGGIADWLNAQFTLEGANYYLLWVVIDLAIAWPVTIVDVAASRMTNVNGGSE
jgi:hypothetical protein